MKTCLKLFLCSGVLFLFSGCATLDVTAKKSFTPAGEKLPVTIGVQAAGDRLLEVLDSSGDSIIRGADGKLFEKVILLPKESKFLQLQETKRAYGIDYILSVGISDISVSADLNPIWFASLPLLVFKVYTPIVTFQPGVSLDVALRDASTGSLLMQKQVVEASSDHYAPMSAGPYVRKLISLTINNALVSIMQDTQKSIASAKKGN